MQSMRVSVDEKVQLVTANKEKIDEMIRTVVENYVPERINPVDRAILRLGAAEIMFDKEMPAPVAINEAIEISQKFASTDSSKFINGILDKISKTIAQLTPEENLKITSGSLDFLAIFKSAKADLKYVSICFLEKINSSNILNYFYNFPIKNIFNEIITFFSFF
jgi:transcription antitermination factor NusB